jgi:hypothetical protein
VNFLAPFKFYRSEPRPVEVEAQFHSEGEEVVADTRLIGRRTLPNQKERQVTSHFTARVRLTKQPPKPVTVPALATPAGYVVDAAEIYRLYFHGPAYQVIEKAWWDGKRIIGLMAKGLPDNHHPSELPTLMAPRLIELCFQTAGVWEMGVQGRMGLPRHIDRVSVAAFPDLEERVYAVVTPRADESFDAQIVDAAGNLYVQLSGYRTVTLPSSAVDAEGLKTLQAILSAEEVAAV